MQVKGLDVAVVGGGIGGMAAAVALAQRGAQVTVHEQASAIQEVGAGLQISANGQAVLRALGVVDGVPEAATVSTGTRFMDGHTGRAVGFTPAPQAGPTWYMHRADLLALILQAATRAGVTLDLDGHKVPGSVRADLVVAADGGRSSWRSAVDGPDRPQFTGQVAWRALVPWDGAPLPAEGQLYLGTRAHVVLYPLRGGKLANLVAIEERQGWLEEGWHLEGDPEEFRRRFVDFRGQAGEAIAKAAQVHMWALHLRPVAARWHEDNVALLGDAAHATLPYLAQGACLALEDACVLPQALAEAEDLTSGLARYQSLRKRRAERVVAIARGNAWRFHMAKPWAWGAHMVLKLGGGLLGRQLEWVYAYDPTQSA